MNWPPLTETWASAYLQILIGLLVFALGIPAFIFQLIVREDIRHVTARRMKTGLYWSSIVFLIFASLAFVWFLHPSATEVMPAWKNRLAATLVTIIPIFVGFSSAYRLNYYRREKLIKAIAGDILKTYRRRQLIAGILQPSNGLIGRILKRYPRKPLIEEQLLRDLIDLGSHGKAGYEKRLVLEALLEIAQTVQQNGQYAGDDLKDLIQSLDKVVRCGDIAGDKENFYEAADILESILGNLNSHPEAKHSFDDTEAIKVTFESLGLEAIKSKDNPTVVKLLDLAGLYNTEIVFKMGIAALHTRRFLIAISALGKLEAEVLRGGGLSCDQTTFRLFGLLAHFVVSGKAARRQARETLSRLHIESYAAVFVKDCLHRAFDYYYTHAEYEVADHIAVLSSLVESHTWYPGHPFPNLTDLSLLDLREIRETKRPPMRTRRPVR